MPSRRLEDRIRDLCASVLIASEEELPRILSELQVALQEHALRLTNLTAAATVAGQPQLIMERRVAAPGK